jgi:hypothetical protein
VINNNVDNYVITATGTVGTIQGEANMQFNGSILSITGDTTMTGSLTASSKSFDIPHPTKEGFRLRYGVLEGPEHGVYFRGLANSSVIELPYYWTSLVHETSITVQLTSFGKSESDYVVEVKENKIYLSSESGIISSYFFIQAERKDVEKVLLEYKPTI